MCDYPFSECMCHVELDSADVREIINVEEIIMMQSRRNYINGLNIEDIAFCENGEIIRVSQEDIDNWKCCGLNNTDFITTGYYKEWYININYRKEKNG